MEPPVTAQFKIPSEPEVIEAQRPTYVELTMTVRGGALEDGTSIVINVPEIELKKPGQLDLSIAPEQEQDLSWDIQRTVDQFLTLKIDKARLVLQDNDGLYSVRVEKA